MHDILWCHINCNSRITIVAGKVNEGVQQKSFCHDRQLRYLYHLKCPHKGWFDDLLLMTITIYASAFSPGGIMFSSCPSVHPSVWSLKYPLSTCTWVCWSWSIRPTVTVFLPVHPLRRRLPTRISAYPDPPVKIKLYLMSCQNVCSVPGDWTYAFTGPIHHRWLHTQVGVRKRAYIGRKRALTWAVGTLSQTDYFSLTAVKIWQAVVANVPGLNVLLYLGLNTCEHLCYTYVCI